jgi:TolA-binding protein
MNCRWLLISVCAAALLMPSKPSRADIKDARRDINVLRYDRAVSELVDVARNSSGGEKQEALYLLAGLKSSVSEAEIIYQEVIHIDPKSDWAARASVEMAKVQFAMGNYGRAYDILNEASACRASDEACYFLGVSGLMLKRYPEAREALSRIQRGKYGAWASLSLAEIDDATRHRDEACRAYRSLGRSKISPTAMYRYGECLEEQGDVRQAENVFEEITTTYRSTPEAVLAREKLDALQRVPLTAEQKAEAQTDVEPPTKGFTLQFGSFRDRTNAIKLMAEIKQQLPGVRIDSDLLDFKEVHRVRYGQYATREEAAAAQAKIAQQVSEPSTIMPLP